MPEPLTNGETMLDIIGTGGDSCWTEKAVRDLIAAYLNESVFGAEYPAPSLTWLTDQWYAALGDDTALDAFHNLVGGWNSPTAPGLCPLP